MNRTKTLCLAVLAIVLVGCASGPSYKEVSASFKPPAQNEGRIFFYRPSALGAAIQPAVKLNGQEVGKSVSHGFFYVDRPPGDYEVTTTTEVKKSLTFRLDRGQTKYVRLNISMGLMVGHVYPELVENSVGQTEIEKTKSIVKK